MSNSHFKFKQFTIHQDRCAMKVTTDSCLFGAWVVDELKNKNEKSKSILDIGTGTGLLTLMIAQEYSENLIEAIEIDKDTFEQAEENITASPWNNRINILYGDVKQFPFTKKYDLIISNPPFYENELQSEKKKKNIAHHSQDLLLNDLLQIIKQHLTVNGIFFLLLPYKRKDEIELLFEKNDLFISKKIFVRQTVNHNYFRIMIEGNVKADAPTEGNEIPIKNNEQQYTAEFIKLLKDYYLFL